MPQINNNQTPVLAVRNLVMFPGITTNLSVGRVKSITALKKAQEKDGHILAILQKTVELEIIRPDDLYPTGTLCKIERIQGSDKEGYQVLLRGLSRHRALRLIETEDLMAAETEERQDIIDADDKTREALLKSLKTVAQEILELLPADTRMISQLVGGIHDLALMTNLCAGTLDLELPKKQELLETLSLKSRALALLDLMQTYKDTLKVQNEIRDKMSHQINRQQREILLREQLKAIHEELGDQDGTDNDDYHKRIEEAKMPEDAKKVALDELKRLETIGNQSPEAHVIRNYLDLLCSLPWAKSSPEFIDIEKARDILNRDHYGLDKIKKRILQHLAVMKLKKDGRGSILLFVGPPGVGKTSLGQSIARALGRKFVRASLGGVRDDAEIRGHRRTYIGAMPGRIIQSIKRAGENNPVFMLDEIDKLANSFHGDPAAALLEVLDPEQNSGFMDHYLDVPFDLSRVLFIATANTVESIPGALLDRMEVIELSGYTTAEKLHIAKTHLVEKQLSEHGLTSEKIIIPDETILSAITHYTREAGVRELQRKIAAIARYAAEQVVTSDGSGPLRISSTDLDEVLGPERFQHEVVEETVPPGVVTGLAWTPQGGEILFIETNLMPGKGKLTLTGQLGDVMKESAQIALSVTRSLLSPIVDKLKLEKNDLHIHVPAGAIPKDGPSAGTAIMTALASLFTGISVDPKLAMTGEISLRGAVMPVGGIKEKVIGAHRAGIKRIILSKKNERDLRDVPEEVKSQIRFEFVERASDAIEIALGINVLPAQSVNRHYPQASASA